MSKSPDAFRTISEVADWLDTPAHVLRFWESKFSQVKPIKRAGGRRYYRPADMQLLGGIKRLLHQDGLTIKDVQALLREKGAKHVGSLSTFDVDADAEVVTIESSDQIEVEMVPSDEPVFTSIAPRSDQKTVEPDIDDTDQMSFPGFEFASDRSKTFEQTKPTEATPPAPQPIDISHISIVNAESVTSDTKGLLSLASLLTKDAVTKNRLQLDEIRDQLMNIAASHTESAKS